jgi:hypothetical protein
MVALRRVKKAVPIVVCHSVNSNNASAEVGHDTLNLEFRAFFQSC